MQFVESNLANRILFTIPERQRSQIRRNNVSSRDHGDGGGLGAHFAADRNEQERVGHQSQRFVGEAESACFIESPCFADGGLQGFDRRGVFGQFGLLRYGERGTGLAAGLDAHGGRVGLAVRGIGIGRDGEFARGGDDFAPRLVRRGFPRKVGSDGYGVTLGRGSREADGVFTRQKYGRGLIRRRGGGRRIAALVAAGGKEKRQAEKEKNSFHRKWSLVFSTKIA